MNCGARPRVGSAANSSECATAVTTSQTDLFGEADPAPDAAESDPAMAALGRALPGELRFGTSSWAFPGWAGLVYRSRQREGDLSRRGLAAYSRHPLLRAVGIDRSFYAPVSPAELRAYADSTPDDFRFLMKAHAALTTPRSARRPEFLAKAPEAFLDVEYATRRVIEPAALALGVKLGVVLLQFSPLPAVALRARAQLLDRLHAFLSALPRGVRYAVEWRDREMLGADYEALLADTGAVHGYSAHPRMPRLADQIRGPLVAAGRAAGPLVVRWLLERHQGYEEAKSRYAPFDRLVDPDPVTRNEIVACAQSAITDSRSVLVIVNNKAEGSAPLSIRALAQAYAAMRDPRLAD